ncbi:MAG: hypothetical protein IKE15_01760 [Clostridia bacterium]|nr:hypothetical protein [Clostridia bacterium]
MEKPNKKRLPDNLVVIAGLLVLLAFGLAAILARGGEFDEWERRYLADRPGVSLSKWETDKETEKFLTDHIPARQALVALDSSGQFLAGRNTQLGAWYASGAVIEEPVRADTARIEIKLRRFEKIADTAGVTWLLLTPRTHGWLLRDRMVPVMARAYDTEEESYALLESCENTVTMPETFNADPDGMYYRTDHHWTLQGAYQAYLALGERLGYEPLPLEDFRLTEYSGFRGTTLSRSGLPALWQDTLMCAEPDSAVTLTIIAKREEQKTDSLIFPDRAKEWDGYAVYLNGNHGTLIIERPDAPEGTLIVYKDSMANCLLPMLSSHFRRVIAVDARYDSGVFSDALARSDDTKAILFVYSLDSLTNDTEITRKAK